MSKITSHTILLILVSISLAGTLFNSTVFGPPTMAAYFFYTIPAVLLALMVGITLFRHREQISIAYPLPLLFFILLTVYYIINGWMNEQGGGINLRHYYMVVNTLVLLSYCMSLATGSVRLLTVSYVVTALAGIEAGICLLQQPGIISSMDELFTVTGSCSNPNVTAMFLAMAIPALWLVFFYGSRLTRIMAVIILCASVTALILLQCRTAFIGAVTATAFILNNRYGIINRLKRHCNKIALTIIGLSVTCGIILISTFLYYSKQSSSESRKFIWKISLPMLTAKPLMGVGYGQFQHDYNLAQASYFQLGLGTPQEISNAAYVRMSYNELLENVTEGGVTGLLFFMGVLVVLLIKIPSLSGGTDEVSPPAGATGKGLPGMYLFAYSGIAAFAVMSVFNFTVQALPVMALFIMYAAVCIVSYPTNNSRRLPAQSIGLSVGILSLFLFFQLVVAAKAYRQCSNIMNNTVTSDETETARQMAVLQAPMQSSVYYWHSYGSLFYQYKNYALAADKLEQASRFSSDPNLYIMLGNCYRATARYAEARQAYTLAGNIEPHHFAPRYALMKLYADTRDTANALLLAQQIVHMQPKIPSGKVTRFKTEARDVLQLFTTKNNSK